MSSDLEHDLSAAMDTPNPESGSEPPSQTGEQSLGARLAGWAQSLPDWQQDLVVRLLGSESLTEEEEADTVSRLLAVSGYDNGEQPEAARLVDGNAFAAYDSQTEGAISKLGQLKSVNGLVGGDNPPLEFGRDGITVIYGENAAGKTSYARTLKFVGRSVGKRPRILPDVRADGDQPTPKAEITLLIDGDEKSLSIEFGEEPPAECSIIRAFDAGASDVYVEEENVVDFTPPVLTVFGRLAQEQKSISDGLKTRIAELKKLKPDLFLGEETEAFSAVEEIAEVTDFEEFKEAFTVSEKDEVRLAELSMDLTASGEGRLEQIQAANTSAAKADALIVALGNIEAIVSNEAIGARVALAIDAVNKENGAKALSDEAFDENERGAEAIAAWRLLWQAARDYFHTVEGHDAEFPPQGDERTCPLCDQKLEDKATTRFNLFEKFVTDDIANQARDATEKLRSAEQALKDELPVLDPESLAIVRELSPQLGTTLDAYTAAAIARRGELLFDDSADGKTPLPAAPTSDLEAFAQLRRDRATALKAMDDGVGRETLEKEHAELTARVAVAGAMDALESWHATFPELSASEHALELLETSDVTRKHGEFSKEVVTNDYLVQLKRELVTLGLDYFEVGVKERGQSGGRMVRVQMNDFKHTGVGIGEVLSEGERRGLGLACFLAELATLGGKGPIVLDDPVSSFDHQRRARVAERLFEESKRRQVIVFTHDVSFTLHFKRLAKAGQRKLEVRHVARKAGQPGYVENNDPIELRSVGTRAGELDLRLNALPDPEEATEEHLRAVQAWYTDLRKLWERALEKELLKGVSARFDRAVHVDNFRFLLIEREDEIAVAEAMSRCHELSHDAPEGEQVALPNLEEMRGDLAKLQALVKSFKDRRRDAEAA